MSKVKDTITDKTVYLDRTTLAKGTGAMTKDLINFNDQYLDIYFASNILSDNQRDAVKTFVRSYNMQLELSSFMFDNLLLGLWSQMVNFTTEHGVAPEKLVEPKEEEKLNGRLEVKAD